MASTTTEAVEGLNDVAQRITQLYIEDLVRRLTDTQRALSAVVHHGHLDVEAVKALDDAIEAFPRTTWSRS